MITFLGVQIIGVLFAVFMAYFTFVYFKRNEFSLPVLIFWELLWIALIFVTSFPASTNFFLEKLGFTRAMDFLTVLGFMFILGLSFYNYIVIARMRKKMERLVRKDALRDFKKK